MKTLDPIGVRLSGRVLIEASAGTGKTYAITTLYVRLLLERELDVASILVVTYTRAATAELRDRIRGRLLAALAVLDGVPPADESELVALLKRRANDAQRDRRLLLAALRDFDQAAIFTIHAFCQRVLTEHALQTELPFGLQLAEHDPALLDDIAADYWSQITFAAPRGLLDPLRKLGVGGLVKLARATVRDDGVRILPSPPPPELDPIWVEPFVRARAHAAQLWVEHRARLLHAWRTSDSLKRNQYSLQTIDKWLPELDGLPTCPADLPDCVAKLTPSALREGARKGTTFDASHPFYAALQALVDAAAPLHAAAAAAVVRFQRLFVDHARLALERQHSERGELGFDDLLQALSRALHGPGGGALARTLSARFPVALIDEFQDTDPVQYGIFRSIYSERDTCLCMIGDPKQAIYAFRGADVLAYVAAARDEATASFTLGVNWRSDPSLLRALGKVYARASRPFMFETIAFVPVEPRPAAADRLTGDRDHALQLLFVPAAAARTDGKATQLGGGWAEANLPGLIAGEITALLHGDARIDGRPVLPADIAVLCRTNKQARATQAALASLRVPTVLDGDRSVFEGETAQDLGRVLAAIAAPTDGRRLSAALVSPTLGVSAQALLAMVASDDGFEPWLERLARWNELWRERGFVRMFQALLEQGRVQQNLLAMPDGERRLTDLLHLGELLHETASRERLGPEALLGWLWQRRHEPSNMLAAESAQLRLEHDERALKLTTVHRSKGLQYPIVFCPFAWKSAWVSDVRFHDPLAGDAPTLDLGSSDLPRHRAIALRESVAEDARLLYVALTRAKHRCYVVWGRFRDAGTSALAYLLHQRPLGTEPAEVEARYDGLNEALQLAELRDLAEASGGALGVREIGLAEPRRWLGAPLPTAGLAARSSCRTLHPSLRASSFSRMVAAQARLDAAREDDARDVDAQAADAPASVQEPEALPLLAPAKVLLHDFPAGPGPGTLIHAIYEHIDFATADVDAVRAVAEPLARSFHSRSAIRIDALAEGIVQTLDTPLDPGGELRLRRIALADRRSELEFTLCTQRARHALSARALADALTHTRALPDCPDYPARLAALPNVLAGEHLKGFVDLVFRQRGRYYVADYKSNKLGEHAADYGREAVLSAMAEHHYFLQAYLYALALHRHLQLKLPSYDYERCFGGVAYLFVRGMAPSHPAGTAVWLDRPSLATLEALGEALGEGRAP